MDTEQRASVLQRHLAIGKASLTRGLIDIDELGRAMFELGTRTDNALGEFFWISTGRLTPIQLEAVRTELDSPTVVTDPPSISSWVRTQEVASGGKTGGQRYRSVELLGRGGMGSVFECEDVELKRSVALKSVRKDYTGSKEQAARMLVREARLTGGLEHPNIIPIYDIGDHHEHGPHFVMRLVDEPTLADVLAEVGRGDKETAEQYRLGRLLRYFIQICQALDYGHSRGIIHCDLKPSNILLGTFGEVLIVDWGLAFSVDEGIVYRGGTPGYMAPEQLDPSRTAFDARTDVFALGCILYEILTLKMAFPKVSLASMLVNAQGLRPPPLPRELAPEQKIPEDLEEIAMKALAFDPKERYATARDIAVAIEAVVEGTKERERRRARADELAREGDNLASSCFEHYAARPGQVAEIAGLRATTMGWEPSEKKRELWEAEDRLAVNDHVGTRLLQAAISGYEQALAQVPDHVGARAGLMHLYRGELQRAIQRRDEFNRHYFEELVRLYDDGSLGPIEEQPAELSVKCEPAPVRVALSRIEERERRFLPEPARSLGQAPVARFELLPGQYMLSFLGVGPTEVAYPLTLASGESCALEIDLRAAQGLELGEVFVPAGQALIGPDHPQVTRGELTEVQVPAFVIAARPVTTAEYLAFIADAFRGAPDLALRHLPSRSDGVPYWEPHVGGFRPVGMASWGGYDDLVALPVIGIDATSAEAFCAWKAEQTGRPYRLPTEHEWEKAARGSDGRRYPWGDAFDASFCKMRESRPFAPRPEPSGAFPLDRSPYGVMDLAGGVADWVTPTSGGREDPSGDRLLVTRGGAWCDWQVDCIVGTRRPAWASERAARVGFRLARSAM